MPATIGPVRDGSQRTSLPGAAGPGAPYLAVCLRALQWAEERNYIGYSKFDALNSPLLRWLAGNNRYLRGGFTYLVSRAPVNVRPLVGVRKRQNPNGLALFASTYFNLWALSGDAVHLDKGLDLLTVLLRLSQATRYAGHCWGYCHDWETGKFFVPQYEPNTVVTVFVAHAFLSAYRLTGRIEFLDVAASSTRFLRENLHVTLRTPAMKSYGYTPFDRWTALNTNALIAGLCAVVFEETHDPALAEETRLIVNFLLDRQTADGAWYHADPPQASHRRIDNYHMGFILHSLHQVHKVFPEDAVFRAYCRGLEFYRRQLFLPSGAPKFQSHQTYPHDIVACAQGILAFTRAARFERSWLADARRVAEWTLQHMWDASGRFYYQRGRFWVARYTLMRWCQAWMSYALSELVRGLQDSASP